KVLTFIEGCKFEHRLRIWKEADLFTLIVESYRKIVDENLPLSPEKIGGKLARFYFEVDHYTALEDSELTNSRTELDAYYAAIFQSTNDRTKRVTRGVIIAQKLDPDASGQLTFDDLIE
ncbi:MAG TPA: hypothetical protein VHD90_14970, partial [Phototrophicaceae bacterium]|nr:hypothetical protein [Phototrophicaceae bacterium]